MLFVKPVLSQFQIWLSLMAVVLVLTACTSTDEVEVQATTEGQASSQTETTAPQLSEPTADRLEAIPMETPKPEGKIAQNTPVLDEEPSLPVADESTPTPEVTQTQEVDWLQVVTVEGDYYWLGNPNAAVRLIDFSDFL